MDVLQKLEQQNTFKSKFITVAVEAKSCTKVTGNVGTKTQINCWENANNMLIKITISLYSRLDKKQAAIINSP